MAAHGSPEDRGSADAYYGRSYNPHYWLDNIGCDVVPQSRMTKRQIAAYKRGYENETDRKSWD